MNNRGSAVVEIAYPPLLARRRAIPTRTKQARVSAAASRRRKRTPRRAPGPSRRPRATRRRRRPVEQPLGVGVGDAFALRRLNVPPQPSRARADKGVREIGWAEFGDVARDLATSIGREFHPDVVLGVVNGGVFLGGALAVPLKSEFLPVRVEKRGKRVLVRDSLGELRGKAVLVVDDVTVSGTTLGTVSRAALKAGARETRTATLVVRPSGSHSDFYAVETNDVVVFGWDYQLHGDGGAGTGDPGEVGV